MNQRKSIEQLDAEIAILENKISTDFRMSFEYAMNCLNDRFIKGERLISTDGYNVIYDPYWSTQTYWDIYAKHFDIYPHIYVELDTRKIFSVY